MYFLYVSIVYGINIKLNYYYYYYSITSTIIIYGANESKCHLIIADKDCQTP